jgi:DNA damage-binding protein 1
MRVISTFREFPRFVLFIIIGPEVRYLFRIPELTLLALTFIPSNLTDELCLAILHIDYQQRLQLLSRDLDVSSNNEQLSPKPSALFPPAPLPQKSFPGPFTEESLPALIPIPAPPSSFAENTDSPQGGILILGGKKVLYYDFAPSAAQTKSKGKSSRTEKKMKTGIEKVDANKLKAKEAEREWKKRKVQAWVEWPWSEVAAWCKVGGGGEGNGGNRFLVGDVFGRLGMVSVDLSEDRKITLLALGEVRFTFGFD